MKNYLKNLETSRIELHFTKEEYTALGVEEKKELHRNFIFSNRAVAWVSRSTKNHYSAIRTAEKLGFMEEEKIGEKLSYAEQLERKAARAEAKAERYEGYAENAIERAENMQSEFNKYRGDIAFLTQPNINSSSGRAFTNQRNRILDRYSKGFEEYRKSEYFKSKALTALKTANMPQLKNATYLNNRIRECEASLRKYERRLVNANEQYSERLLEFMEEEIDKLAFFKNCLEEIGGIKYSKDNINKDDIVLIRGKKAKVIRANTVTVSIVYIDHPLEGWTTKCPYTEIQSVIELQ